MEVGCDYLLLRTQYRGRVIQYLAAFVIVLGSLLIAMSGAYYIYAHEVRSTLQEQNFSLPVTEIFDPAWATDNIPDISIGHNSVIEGFEPVRAIDGAIPGTLSRPTRILVPALKVDSKVN